MNSYTETVRVGVAGATGYTGVELLRLLGRHPGVTIAAAMGSPGAAPRHVPSLKSLWDATVDGLDVEALAENTDAVFLALPEHAAAEVAPALLARGKRVFDLSGAFRLRDAALRQRWYPKTGDQPASVVYGLTERNRDLLRDSTLVACAGCYPTAAILALQPLLQANLVGQPIIIDAKSGVSGAGRRRPSGPTSASATAACRPTASSITGTPRKSSRSSASRSRSCRICCRSIAGSSKRSMPRCSRA